MLHPRPYVITVDTEEEWDWSSGYPTGPIQVKNINRLIAFQDLVDRFGAAVTYFVNHAVLVHPESAAIIHELAARPRVEIGMHIHPWNTPPLQNVESVSVRESFLHNLPAELAIAKLNTVYETFRNHELRPVSFRGGRYSTSPLIQDWLRQRGFIADASILPFTHWSDDGAPDYRQRTPFPVRIAGEPPLWEVPLSLAFTRQPFALWNTIFGWAETTPLRHLRVVGVLQKCGVVRKSWLNFENPLGEGMNRLIRVLDAAAVPYLCFTLHSSSLMPGGSPYSSTVDAVRRLLDRVEFMLSVLSRQRENPPATIAQIAQRMELMASSASKSNVTHGSMTCA